MNVPFWAPTLIAAAVIIFLEWRRRSRFTLPASRSTILETKVIEISGEPDSPVGFGRKNAWVAVRASDASQVASSLKLSGPRPANWQSGVRAAYAYPSQYVFVTPPLDGWVIATGVGLPDPGNLDQLQEWRSLMKALSERFGDAQYFATHRGSSYTAWSRYSGGVEHRLFAHADDPIHSVGDPFAEEADLIAHLPDQLAAETDPDYWKRDDIRTPEEDDVFRLAAAWSFDPTTLDSADLPPSAGIVGEMHNH